MSQVTICEVGPSSHSFNEQLKVVGGKVGETENGNTLT